MRPTALRGEGARTQRFDLPGQVSLRNGELRDGCRDFQEPRSARSDGSKPIAAQLSASRCPSAISSFDIFDATASRNLAKFSARALGACRGKVEPFVGEDEILRNAVALVVHQSEHGLRERITLNGAPGVEIGGGNIGLRFAKTVFVQEAKQAERLGVSPLSQRRQFPGRANIIAPGIGCGAARQRVGMRDGVAPMPNRASRIRPTSIDAPLWREQRRERTQPAGMESVSVVNGHWWSLLDLSKSWRYLRAVSIEVLRRQYGPPSRRG